MRPCGALVARTPRITPRRTASRALSTSTTSAAKGSTWPPAVTRCSNWISTYAESCMKPRPTLRTLEIVPMTSRPAGKTGRESHSGDWIRTARGRAGFGTIGSDRIEQTNPERFASDHLLAAIEGRTGEREREKQTSERGKEAPAGNKPQVGNRRVCQAKTLQATHFYCSHGPTPFLHIQFLVKTQKPSGVMV